MKKLLLLSLIIVSCKTQSYVKESKSIVVTWKSKSETFDVYANNLLILQHVPCDKSKKITLHAYPPGLYTFVFKKNDNVVEEKKIKIMK
jgi:hypothetical protein